MHVRLADRTADDPTAASPTPIDDRSCAGHGRIDRGWRATRRHERIPCGLFAQVRLIARAVFGAGARRAQLRDAPEISRRTRLITVARHLETVLDELDALGSQRTAIDICMALERIRLQIAACEAPDVLGADPSPGGVLEAASGEGFPCPTSTGENPGKARQNFRHISGV